MIDIHSHILPFVDDGSKNLSQSIKMLRESQKNGVSDIILTPHYRFDYLPTKERVLDAFEVLKSAVKQSDISINLYLGQEIFADKNILGLLSQEKLLTMCGTKYVLVEFDLSFKKDIVSTVYELKRMGFIPIIAHIERYFYADMETCSEIKRYGGLLQVNACSIVGKGKRRYIKLVKELFANDYVDFVASDVHFNRENLMAKCNKFITKKYGANVAKKVFIDNAKKIIEG